MRLSSYVVCLFWFATVVSLTAFAQQAPPSGPEPFYFVALIDPACPVVAYSSPVPIAKEIRVLYFPFGKNATIKAPKSLFLHIAFDTGFMAGGEQTVSLSKRDDGVWVARVSLEERLPSYAVYWFEDRETKETDKNGGEYFGIPFCDAHGNRADFSVMSEARSYTGVLSPYGIDRPTDYAKAVDILKSYIHPPSRGENLIADLWKYELKLYGDDEAAQQKLLPEINQFVSDHAKDGFGVLDGFNFVAYQNWIPPETTDAFVKVLEGKYPENNPRAFLLQAQVVGERDKDKRIALEWELVNKYPDSHEAEVARRNLAVEVKDFTQREQLYQQLRAKHPENPSLALSVAVLYYSENKKLPEALTLLDEAEKLLDANQQDKHAKIHYFESTIAEMKLRIAVMQADILLRTGKPAEALVILQANKGKFISGASYYVLGKALESTGDKRGAVEAYLEAVVRPSTKDKEANAALDRLWKSEKLGKAQDLQRQIEQKLAQNFTTAAYVPLVQSLAAPDFELTTLKGERISSSSLRGKTVILNFWAPWCGACQPELKPLQDFQAKHPELVLATVIDDAADPKELAGFIREKKLNTLRICKVSAEFNEKFNVVAIPDTLVIDANGYIRVQHLGAIPDVEHYLDTDLQAIAAAGAPKQLANNASK